MEEIDFITSYVDGNFYVTHGKYPGLMTDGKTLNSAMKKFHRAKKTWLRIAEKAGWENILFDGKLIPRNGNDAASTIRWTA